MAAALDAGLRLNGWFVTGRVDASLFSDSFFFSDPQVRLSGAVALNAPVRWLSGGDRVPCPPPVYIIMYVHAPLGCVAVSTRPYEHEQGDLLRLSSPAEATCLLCLVRPLCRPQVSLTGVDKYAEGVAKLFNQEESRRGPNMRPAESHCSVVVVGEHMVGNTYFKESA